MAALVPIPWQPHLYLTPHTLSYLVAASRRVGRNLYLYDRDYTRVSPAWRSFTQQLTAWLKGLAGTGPKASSPYTGQRNHMRGAAFDLRETSASVQAACRAVGLVRDSSESWHWNDPLWRSMPIIKTRTASAGTTPKPLPTPTPENEDDMTDALYQFNRNSADPPVALTNDNAVRTLAVSATLPGGGGQHIVKPLAVYHQERPGDPLTLIQVGAEPNTTGADYKPNLGNTVEIAAFINAGRKVQACTGAQLAALVSLRGITASG